MNHTMKESAYGASMGMAKMGKKTAKPMKKAVAKKAAPKKMGKKK
jgi:hypothetical protein